MIHEKDEFYSQFYDSEKMGLKTTKIHPDELADLLAGFRDNLPNSPLSFTSTWYKGFIDRKDINGDELFPHAAGIYYQPDGLTGAETRVDFQGVTSKGEFTVNEKAAQS